MRPDNIYTPNVVPGNPDGGRYVLYRHGPKLFSATPTGKQFRAAVVPDACGLGCMCGARIESIDKEGERQLSIAEQIDHMGETIKEVTQ